MKPRQGHTVRAQGFPPVADASARVLVLGSLPGPVSLRERQYYAQPRNAFWPIMGALFGASLPRSYDERLQILIRHGIAMWDVCASAHRVGALDAAIHRSSVVPNDLAAFLASHRQVRLICFNGQTAAQLYRRHVLPTLPASLHDIRRETLPSTSPAYAAMRFEEKLARWSVVCRA